MTSSRRGLNDYFDEEETDQKDKSGSVMTAVVSQPALRKHVTGQGSEFQKHFPGQGSEVQKHVPGPRPEFPQQIPGQGPESPMVANEVEMADAENPPVEPVSDSLKPAAPAPQNTKKISDRAWCGPCKNRTGNGFVGHWTRSCPFAAESGFMEACARCGSLDHCVSFCPRLTWNGKRPVKIKDLYFFLVTSRQGLPPAVAEVDPRVIDRERWEKEVEYPQTPALARHRREGALNNTLPGRLDLNLWNELDVNTGLSLGLQIYPAHIPGEYWLNITSRAAKQKKQSWSRSDSVLHGTMGDVIAKIPRRETQTRGGDRGREESDRGGGFGHGREAAPRGSGNFGVFDQTQRSHLPSLSSQKKFDFLLGEFDRQQTRERHNIFNWFEATQKERRSMFVSEIIARIQGTFGEVRGATSGLDADPRRGEGHGLEYPGHLPSQTSSDQDHFIC
ncbi:hypothetical protein EAF00_001183 [Botryotinia globosa]|nr:hypothetical protein EAF00_001183 [Botryotinia globosa]